MQTQAAALQEMFDSAPPAIELTMVVMKQREIVHVAHVALCAQHLLAEVVQAVQVEIGEELTGEVADRQPAAALERREQIVSRVVENAPWSFAKVLDLLRHLPVPIIVIGTAGTAALIRVLRGSLLDELRKQYVITARAKGLGERPLLFKYPVRVAVNPLVSTVGWLLPEIVSGETIVAIVLGLPTIGPLVFFSLLQQDMFLAGSTIMLLSFLTVIGTLLSDLMLVWVDPRIRFEAVQS